MKLCDYVISGKILSKKTAQRDHYFSSEIALT